MERHCPKGPESLEHQRGMIGGPLTENDGNVSARPATKHAARRRRRKVRKKIIENVLRWTCTVLAGKKWNNQRDYEIEGNLKESPGKEVV